MSGNICQNGESIINNKPVNASLNADFNTTTPESSPINITEVTGLTDELEQITVPSKIEEPLSPTNSNNMDIEEDLPLSRSLRKRRVIEVDTDVEEEEPRRVLRRRDLVEDEAEEAEESEVEESDAEAEVGEEEEQSEEEHQAAHYEPLIYGGAPDNNIGSLRAEEGDIAEEPLSVHAREIVIPEEMPRSIAALLSVPLCEKCARNGKPVTARQGKRYCSKHIQLEQESSKLSKRTTQVKLEAARVEREAARYTANALLYNQQVRRLRAARTYMSRITLEGDD